MCGARFFQSIKHNLPSAITFVKFLLDESNHMGIAHISFHRRSSTSLCDWDAFAFHWGSCYIRLVTVNISHDLVVLSIFFPLLPSSIAVLVQCVGNWYTQHCLLNDASRIQSIKIMNFSSYCNMSAANQAYRFQTTTLSLLTLIGYFEYMGRMRGGGEQRKKTVLHSSAIFWRKFE